jgi:MraZ protein
VLARDGDDTLFCYPALDRPALEAGGRMLMSEIEDLINRFAPFSDEREQFATALYGTSELVKMDAEGRVTLSDPLKDHAGIMDSVAFVGLGHKFQIWAPDRFSARLSEATGKMRSLKKRLGAEHAAVNPQGARE